MIQQRRTFDTFGYKSMEIISQKNKKKPDSCRTFGGQQTSTWFAVHFGETIDDYVGGTTIFCPRCGQSDFHRDLL